MSAPLATSYRLATAAQWRDGVLAGAVRGADGRMHPFAPYARPGRTFAQGGAARLPAIGGTGTAWWHGADGFLYRFAAGADDAEQLDAPHPIACTAVRLVAGRRVLWAAGPDRKRLHCFAQDSLHPILSVDLAAPVIDLADAGRDGVWLLAAADKCVRITHFSCAGTQLNRFDVPLPPMQAIAFLADANSLVLLERSGTALWFLDLAADPAPPRQLRLAAFGANLGATALASDGRSLLFVAIKGNDDQRRVLVTDASGDRFDQIALAGDASGVAARGSALLATGPTGATLYSSAGASTSETVLELITPVLHSPKRADARGWLRAELSARLPPGATLAVDYAESGDAHVRASALRIARDRTQTPRQRFDQLSLLFDTWSKPVHYAGSADTEVLTEQLLSVPLFDARREYLWLRIRLAAPAGGALPQLGLVRVLYPDRSLVQQLPAIYRNEEPGDFLRRLVGVLETTTQDLDRRISTLGRLLNPDTADEAWLDYTARWLGLPWDDALEVEQKRALMRAAPGIMAARGTRRGLEALLACLFPGAPRRFRVRDTADLEPLRLGGGAGLPALLTGLPCNAAVIGRRAVLGRARLPDPNAPGAGVAPPARVRIDISVTAAQRQQVRSWLPAMIDALIPVTARADLRWSYKVQDGMGTALGEDTVLGVAPEASLGNNTIIGAARLSPGELARLSGRGPDAGFQLR